MQGEKNMEYEIRFYFSKKDKEKILEKLKGLKDLHFHGKLYEKTTQYNSTLEGNDFYSKAIDGRYRVRVTRGEEYSKCMLSWKRRLKDTSNQKINKEEEIECGINSDDYENFIYITENVLKMQRVESYERYRNVFSNDLVEVVLDEYPFGLALEIEAKTSQKQEQVIEEYMEKLNLTYEESYKLSWDDKYEELCKNENLIPQKDVLFSCVEMPEIRD